MYQFSSDLTTFQQRINHFLTEKLAIFDSSPAPLAEAMKYGVLLGGKRIRPFLIYATGRMLGADLNHLDYAAAAIECMHCYSLIHDDLPAMDNDTLRRNKPTCHIVFDQATAILAADALQAFSFELLTHSSLSTQQQLAQIKTLAQAAGANGMCLGQSLDLISEHKTISLAELERIHRNKTGALIVAAVKLGLYASPHFNHFELEQKLTQYAEIIGLAFQVQDDILDITASSEQIGKKAGSDLIADKSTYPKLLGLEQAQQKALELQQQALTLLANLPFNTQPLAQLARFIVERKK
ncbi:(2E,6E)-farnesyl diphosphate synthase [Mergibacter septicus]|uniref:(2E,6E)-farnesyl diphosphate synthase n=1 Tax=Mergibacter septicus TaxID=221402 RepID=A0A8D4LJ79_9PAST|nr:(2E,6E)-farnesyl diphosphate synthase [Mergibacter septicus]AWX15280.1 (2E,6E)-farnesyl diphosphate synthase [Mergibacter septicus]QDJ12757.1 (2E,6E)-farnesyl diphosphate synthase [Mergibacter septicus]QDJ14534.1 (2E,6E)-farnesyl diphosphate synthase [Mergibacter septicus]UTU48030.1 (2E,6E)-farnesyl diphosphate synthase [Mergibacter septicus]WMR96361.1 (2E,6E)-farnesyl diphosphate synthase [Mergibacter septicus]